MPHFSVRAARLVAAAAAVMAVSAACLADNQRPLALSLLDDMSRARARLVQDADLAQTCDQAGVVRGKLYSEVRMNLPPEPWGALRRANDAFFAACGQLILLSLPGDIPAPSREQWRRGADLQLASMCESLRQAAAALGQPSPAPCS